MKHAVQFRAIGVMKGGAHPVVAPWRKTRNSLLCSPALTSISNTQGSVSVLIRRLRHWEQPGCYALRGAPAHNIDRLAEEGMRLLTFNTEPQCTPSRSALMTGRFAIRSGNCIWRP